MEILFSRFLADFAALNVVDVGAFFSILLIDAAFSGDNSILINVLASGIQNKKTRVRVIWCGMVLAAVLRFVALCFAAFIMENAWVQIFGALYLWKISYDYFFGEKKEQKRSETKSVFLVFASIGFLDLTLSFDNIIGVFALSRNLVIIVGGVMASIAMLAVATQIVRKLMERYSLIEPAAYLILVFLGCVIVADKGGEFLIWLGSLVMSHKEMLSEWNFRLGDAWKTGGVLFIIVGAIILEELRKFKK